jgi:hypothetical protein
MAIKTIAFRLFCLAVLVTASRPAAAQVLYGSLVGRVEDPSGAAVAGASIELLSSLTGLSRNTTTDAEGAYLFSNVPSGVFEVRATAAGFKQFRRTAVEIPANAVPRVNITLQLGETAESVTVTSESSPLKTDRSDVSMDLRSKDLDSLPVGGYRNYQSLMKLVPGVTPPATAHSIAGNPAGSLVANVNGTSRSNNNTRIDGASSIYLWLPHITAYVPPLESIGTVNFVTNSYDAEQGFAGGAVISVETKSGTNEFHGSGFEYHTNSRMRARNFFFPAGEGVPKNLLNQFGGILGGPILRNRLFFFGSYEAMRQRQSFSRFATIPAAAHRTGNFSDANAELYDPLTGTATGASRSLFAGAVVPASRIDGTVRRLLGLVPQPNRPGFNANYFISAPLLFDRDNYDGKLNWNPTSRLMLFGRYSRFDYAVFDPHVLGEAGGQGVATIFPGNDGGAVHSTTIGGSYAATPALLLDGHFGFQQQGQYGQDLFFGKNIGLDDLKLPGTNGPTIRESGFPGFQVSGYENIGGSIPSSPRFRTDRVYQYALNAALTKGSHNLRWGFELAQQQMNHYQPAGAFGPRGGFNFTGGVTARNGGPAPNQFNTLAAFLLGMPSSVGKSIPTSEEMRTRLSTNGLYFRDRWQVSRSLTLNLGLRWEYYPMVVRDTRGVERFDPSTNLVLIGGVGSVPMDAGVRVSKSLFAPRFGLAYRIRPKLVARLGYGISIDPFPLAIPMRSNYPTVIEQSIVANNTFQPSGLLSSGIPLPPPLRLGDGRIPMPQSVTTITIEDNFRRGYVQSFNFTIQREIAGNFTAQAGYVGSRSIRLTNRPDINASRPGLGVAGRPYFASFGRRVGTTLHAPAYTSDYHSLQARLDRRFTAGLSAGLTYTFSKAINFGDNNDSGLFFNAPEAVARNRALAGFDRTHNLQATLVAELPFGKGKRWANQGVAGAIAGGWQTNAILSSYSGTPFNVVSSGASLNAPGNSQVADLVKPTVEKLGAVGRGMSFFDPLAFRAVTDARFGNAGLAILRGPGLVNLDFSLFRNFKITEKLTLQFRAESFNFTNTPHFNNPGANVSNMQLSPGGAITRLGGYTEVTGAEPDERQFRFAFRFFF